MLGSGIVLLAPPAALVSSLLALRAAGDKPWAVAALAISGLEVLALIGMLFFALCLG